MFKQLIIPILLSTSFLYSQTEKDSLWDIWKDENQADSVRLKTLNHLIYTFYIYTDSDSTKLLVADYHEYAKKKKLPFYIAEAYVLLGMIENSEGNRKKSNEYYLKGIAIHKQMKSYKNIGRIYNNIASNYLQDGNYKMVIKYHTYTLKYLDYCPPDTQVFILCNIGNAYQGIDLSDIALIYYKKALAIKGGTHTSKVYLWVSLGYYYYIKKNFREALRYYKKVIDSKYIMSSRHLMYAYEGIGNCYFEEKKYDSTYHAYKKSIYHCKNGGSTDYLPALIYRMAKIYYFKKNTNKALDYLEESAYLAKKIKDDNQLIAIYELYALIYKEQKEYEKSHFFFKKYLEAKSKIQSRENKELLLISDAKLNIEYKKKIEDLQFIQNKKNKESQYKETLEKNDTIIYGALATGGFGSLFLAFYLWIFFQKRRDHKIILEQKKYLEEQKNKEEYRELELSTIIRQTQDVVLGFNQENQIIYLNQSGKEKLERLFYKENPSYLSEFIPVEKLNKIKEYCIENRHWTGEQEIQLKNNLTIPCLISVLTHVSQSNKERTFSAFIRDISTLKSYENEIQSQYGNLLDINSELDRFIYTTSHDLRSPMISVSSLIEICRKELYPENKDLNGLFSMMKKGIDNVMNTITHILDYSRNSRTPLQIEEIHLSELIEELLEEYRKKEYYDPIDITMKINQKEVFYSDKSRIKTVLKNIIDNSFNYYREEEQDPFIRIYAEVKNKKLLVKIQDNGEGIAQEHQSKIFEMFYRGSSRSEGSGLGLYVSSQIIEKLGGTIKIDSELGKGTTIYLIIPYRSE